MKYKVVGVQHKEGVFTDKQGREWPYNNYNLHTMRDARNVVGQCVTVLKVKADVAADVIALAGGDPAGLVGLTLDVEENRFGKVVWVELV